MDKSGLVNVLQSRSVELLESFLREEKHFKFFQEGALKFWNYASVVNLKDLAKFLLILTESSGSESVADNLIKYADANNIPGLEVLAIQGITIDESIELSDNIKLIPYKDVPDSYAKALYDITSVSENYNTTLIPSELQVDLRKESQFLKSRRRAYYDWDVKPTAALICNSMSQPKIIPFDSEEKINDELNPIRFYDLIDVCRCLSLVGPCSPTPIASWWQPIGWVPDINDSFGRLLLEIDLINKTSHSFESITKKQKAKEIANHFFQLSDGQKEKLRIPLDRLGRAIRRKEIVDKAIELGIAMEAIFLKEKSELTYRLQLRAAWLLGQTVQDRKEIMSLFKKLYDIRSSAVHEGKISYNSGNVLQLISEGIEKVAEAIEIIIRNGEYPDWDCLTLGSQECEFN